MMKRTCNSYKHHIVCLLLVAAILISVGGFARVDATNGAITVTSALSGETVYNGDSLKDAMKAASRGCIVDIERFYTMTSDVVVSCEVMLTNTNRITDWAGYKLLLTGNGAVYVTNRLSRKNYGALHDYSSVTYTEESGGYVYYLEAGVPTFNADGAATTLQSGSGLLGARVNEAAGTILLDTVAYGMSGEKLTGQITVPAINAEKVTISYQNLGSSGVATGTILTASASNYDYSGKVTKNYELIVLGDVNRNGRIDSADANLIVCHYIGQVVLSGSQLKAADVNCDGTVDATDADVLCKKYIRRDSYSSYLG